MAFRIEKAKPDSKEGIDFLEKEQQRGEEVLEGTAGLLTFLANQKTEKKANLEGLALEAFDVEARVEEYKQLFVEAEKVIFIFGCDDGRVGAPPVLQEVDGKQTLMVYVPRIGGGVPNKDLVQFLYDETNKLRGSVKDVRLLLTQHGSTAEVTQACDHKDITECTCGLRAVFKGAEQQLKALGDILRTEQKEGRKTFDTLSSDAISLIELLSTHTGIPKRLIRVAAEANFTSDITRNALDVTKTVADYGIFDKTVVQPAYFNHHSKVVTVIGNDSTPTGEKITVSEDTWNEEYTHQDPKGLVISFGPQSSFTPDGIVLPESVGTGVNNDFTAVAVAKEKGFEKEDLLNALSEVWYAANNYNSAEHGHPHGLNFINVEYCAIICDSAQYVAMAREILASDEFKTQFAQVYAALGEVKLIDIRSGRVAAVALEDIGSGGGKKLTTAIIKQDGDLRP